MNGQLGRNLDILILLGLAAILATALGDQLLLHDLPCPLCLLQRMGFTAAGIGIALNLATEPRSSHYALTILSALLGAAVSARQILLHVAPGTGAYGEAIFGLHFYTWAFLCFTALLVAVSVVLLCSDARFQERPHHRPREGAAGAARFAILLFAAIALLNGLSTIAECKTGMCPDNPVSYLLFERG